MNDKDKILEEIIEEYDLCNKYFMEEDTSKEKTEHERLALKIATDCMQTLGYLIDKMKIKFVPE